MTISDQMTKILGKHISNDDLHNEYDVYKAMQEYADQQSAEKDTQLKDLHQQLSSLQASMDILVDDNERLKQDIEHYKKICEMENVPELIRENPTWLFNHEKLTDDQKMWALAKVEEYQNRKTINL